MYLHTVIHHCIILFDFIIIYAAGLIAFQKLLILSYDL